MFPQMITSYWKHLAILLPPNQVKEEITLQYSVLQTLNLATIFDKKKIMLKYKTQVFQ